MPTMTPTQEQQAILTAYATGQDVLVRAAAGAGKSTSLRLLAEADPAKRGLYLAFNSAIAKEAKTSFPSNVDCRTAHSLAFRPFGARFKHRLDAPRVRADQAARILGITSAHVDGETKFSPAQQATLVMEMVNRFCASADDRIGPHHLGVVPHVDSATSAALATALMPYAQQAWRDLNDPNGQLRFTHGVYLKMFALTQPNLHKDVIFYDEAQDATPCTAQIVAHQQQLGTQVIVVGDSAQSIYGFTGAVNSMDLFACQHTLTLSKSFRFGPAVAAEANKWLTLLAAPIRVSGHDPVASTVGPTTGDIDAVLCRTNMGALTEVIGLQGREQRVAVAGGTVDLKRLAEAARDLKAGKQTMHPELMAFTSWDQVVEYSESDEGKDLKSFVSLIDSYPPDTLIMALDRCVRDSDEHDVMVSTAHKAKGLEWDRVRISTDFAQPDDDVIDRDEAMLAYVAVTRARKHLDLGGLAWVDKAIRERWSVTPAPDAAPTLNLTSNAQGPDPSTDAPTSADSPTITPNAPGVAADARVASPTAPSQPRTGEKLDITPIHCLVLGTDAGVVRQRALEAGITPAAWVRQAVKAALGEPTR